MKFYLMKKFHLVSRQNYETFVKCRSYKLFWALSQAPPNNSLIIMKRTDSQQDGPRVLWTEAPGRCTTTHRLRTTGISPCPLWETPSSLQTATTSTQVNHFPTVNELYFQTVQLLRLVVLFTSNKINICYQMNNVRIITRLPFAQV